MLDAEREVFGIDHQEVGAWLADKWGLPEFLVHIIESHHTLPTENEFASEIALIHLADLFCKSANIGFSGDKVPVRITEDPAWHILKQKKPNIESLDLERFTFDIESEMENALFFIETVLDQS